jgi:hypothetical protein
MNPDLEKHLAEKQARRQWLAALPFPEKIRALVRLQARAAPIQHPKGRTVRVWPPEVPKP